MTTTHEEISLELEQETNRCRMELVSLQSHYYKLIIQKLFIENLRKNENITLYSKVELKSMLHALEEIIDELEAESTIDGVQKYEMGNSLPFIDESLARVMKKYSFSGWEIN